MITINLLPWQRIHQLQQRQNLRMQARIGVIVVALTFIVCGGLWVFLDREGHALVLEKRTKQQQLVLVREQAKQVDEVEQKRELFEQSHAIIDQFKHRQKDQILLLDHVSESLNPLKLWLRQLRIRQAVVEIEGQAIKSTDIVQFVQNLRETDFFDRLKW